MRKITKKMLLAAAVIGLAVAILTIVATNPFGRFLASVRADPGDEAHAHRDHSLFFDGSSPADKAIYCGVQEGKGYTLHISGTASGAPGSFIITFRDGDAMGFNVPNGSTYSTTHDLGGVPGVDDTVRITATGGVHSMMVSVLAQDGAKDPFDETLDGAPKEKDNFCTRLDVLGGGEAGRTSAQALVPYAFP
ncbi:MAG: hypothetical protein HY236_17895 [Acidobacteria bacterium]|nr:hypothetical protein [Acidobacteriota bacterium]